MQLHRKGGRSAPHRRRGPAACDECDELPPGRAEIGKKILAEENKLGFVEWNVFVCWGNCMMYIFLFRCIDLCMFIIFIYVYFFNIHDMI